ncbi:L-lactate dehydrogenase [Sphingomonas sp. MG17]|uniref:L-lactate dehydrogenase n=1 Tax=Sphingomonas tagetis TaxID=2949092 RepID=A0A9X2KPZ3_9SPHN|nr:L-lactate dehydrogenase [Sphingomonas tagetis]MCP3731188.1 L-lactate dehydrogenase [Sphingomonas tagetis]
MITVSSNDAPSRIAFVGAGHVGATAAYAMMLRALFEEIVLIDSNVELASAEAEDLADANALARPARIWAGCYDDAASAQVAVITAGAASHGSESRLSLASRSAAIVRACATGLVDGGFTGVLIVASNPVDLMTVVAMRAAGFAPTRVIGTGTLLDTSRLKQALGDALHVAPGAIDGYVLGEHGDSEVAAFSTVRIGGQTIAQFAAGHPQPDLAALAVDVRDAGYRIITGKGYTSFGIATAIVRICEAIVRDERAVLPVSTWIDRRLGAADICLSLPCVIGSAGIERVLFPPLEPAEEAALLISANALTEALNALDR